MSFNIYNKSSESMSEIGDASVDLIYTSPPYNIGTKYKENSDRMDISKYQSLLKNVFAECFRILKPQGRLIIEVADSIVSEGKYIQLAGLIQSYCIEFGMKVEDRHINFALTKEGEELPEHNWSDDYMALTDAHSNCHQILVLSKNEHASFVGLGKVMYFNYLSTPEHPCPTPKGICDFVLENYFKDGMTVAEPFMGTAVIGREVLKRKGNFIGYELDKNIFETTSKSLSEIN